jgi:predicted nucleic acid-binding protein
MLIVADTSPVNYLVLVEAAHVLPLLYGRIVIPSVVLTELRDLRGPAVVRTWATNLPPWVEVVDPARPYDIPELDAGEVAAIALAQELKADRLLIDDSDGRAYAEQHGIPIAGTLAVLLDAALASMIDLEVTLSRLKETTFRASPRLIDAIREQFLRLRSKDAPGRG